MSDPQTFQEPDSGGDGQLPERFSIVAGGGFHRILGRLGLLDEDQLPRYRAALGLAIIAWSIPAGLVVAQSLLGESYSGWDYFSDPTVYTRYLVAILVMVSTERMADTRVALLIQQFREADILDEISRAAFSDIVRRADRLSNSSGIELLILGVAIVWSLLTTRLASVLSADTWEGFLSVNGSVVLSWAGEGSAFFSNTLFLFLVLRWFWRFFIWARVLQQTSRLSLKIMPLHPDRCGGLGFLGIFPGIFSGLIFALSCVIGASFYKATLSIAETGQYLWLAVAVWLLLVCVIFLGPLVFFLRPLYMARERSILAYGRLAHRHHRKFHRKWMEGLDPGEDILGSADPSSLSDLNASVQTVHEMRVFPVDRPALVQMLVSAGVPLLVAAAMQMPVAELLKLIMGVVF